MGYHHHHPMMKIITFIKDNESVIFCISNRGFPRFQQRICERLAKCTSREALLSRKASLHQAMTSTRYSTLLGIFFHYSYPTRKFYYSAE